MMCPVHGLVLPLEVGSRYVFVTYYLTPYCLRKRTFQQISGFKISLVTFIIIYLLTASQATTIAKNI